MSLATAAQRATAEKVQERREICNNCEFIRRAQVPQLSRCGVCHCVIHLKTVFERASCPKGKW